MPSSMKNRQLLTRTCLLFASACADVVAPGRQGAPYNGLWDFTSHVVYTGGTLSCSDTGSFALSASDSSGRGVIQQVGTCVTATSRSPNPGADSIHVVGVSSDSLWFNQTPLRGGGQALCAYAARIGGANADSLSGTAACTSSTVTWAAVRAGPVGSAIILRPILGLMPTGSTQALALDLRSASGAPLFVRSVVWSSNNSDVVTVSATGVLSAVGPGSATIRVSIEGHADSIKINVPETVRLIATDAGAVGSCALDVSGGPYCWGIAPGQRSVMPLKVNGRDAFQQLTVGYEFACGLDSAGLGRCWGRNGSGQLGNGTVIDTTAPRPMSGSIRFASISAGGDHACGLTAAGVAYCWGSNATGQLGTGVASSGSTSPVAVSGGLSVMAISAGNGHTCAIATTTARVWCWGANVTGQLGDSSFVERDAPVAIGGGIAFASISAGDRRTCGVTTSGSAFCWGQEGFSGSLGTGTTGNQNAPRLVAGGLHFSMVSTGGNHVCGIVTGGAAYCWGANGYGQIGNGSTGPAATAPTSVSGGLSFVTISSGLYTYSDETHNEGTSAHTCGVTTGGITYCWGDNIFGQLGNGAYGDGNYSAVPVRVAGQP